MTRDAELNLLLELCGAAIRDETHNALDADCDWDRLVALARRHRVQGLAWLGLTRGTESEFPPAMELFEDTKEIARQNLLAASAAARLLEEFERRGLAILFLKGLTLGALAYPRAVVKMSADVDVMVDPAELDEAEKCLCDLGYGPVEGQRRQSRRSAAAKEWTWVGGNGVIIDLHARLADNPELLPTLTAHAAALSVEVASGIALRTLPREALFAYLSVHGTSSLWFRLKWAADLAAFISTCGADEVRRWYGASRSLGAGRCPDVALLVVEELFGPMIPADLLATAGRDALTRLLVSLSMREMSSTDEPLDRPLGTVAMHMGQLLMDRGAFPVREFRRQFSMLIG